jgi:hypothetical protein
MDFFSSLQSRKKIEEFTDGLKAVPFKAILRYKAKCPDMKPMPKCGAGARV